MANSVNTAKVANRRNLRFNTIADIQQDLNGIEAAEKAGTLKTIGNWTAGQNLAHVAAWINYAYDGFPIKPAPWFIRFILKFRKKKYLSEALPSGVNIPGVEGGTKGQDAISTTEGIARMRKALQRLASDEVAIHPSPAFGPLNHDERIQLNLRHSELHLSFLQY